jgi:5-methylcytosine-specific restriction endonuclease McrA
MPCDYKKYPKNWKAIRKAVLSRAEHKCELCGAENYKPHWKTGSKVVLTIAHLNQDINDNRPYNLRALCQRCHNIIDYPYREDKKSRKTIEKWIEKMKNKNVMYSPADILQLLRQSKEWRGT